MAGSVLPVRVAGDHREWTAYRRGDHLLRVIMDHNRAADLAIPLKALAIQPLARTRPFDLGESLTGSVSVNVLYGGGLNLRHSGRIRIRLRRHVLSATSGIIDHLEHHGRLGKGG